MKTGELKSDGDKASYSLMKTFVRPFDSMHDVLTLCVDFIDTPTADKDFG